MVRTAWLAVLIPALALAAGPAAAGRAATEAPAGAYRLEPTHSQVLFAIRHMGLTDYHGRFDRLAGDLTFNPTHPERSQVAITIDMTGIDTPSPGLTRELASATVFDVARFPQARFVSTRIERRGRDHGRISGNLTIHNVTKPVTLDVVLRGTAHDPLSNVPVLGFHATTTIKRSDFGLTGMAWTALVGNRVKLEIEAVFEQEKHAP